MHFSKYLFFILILLFAHSISSRAQTTKNYDAEWKRVDDLIKKRNLPKSALEEVKKIYAMAKRDKQDAQIIKSLVYMVGLQQQTREESEISGIKDVEKEIAQNKEPATSILKSLLADLYWQYFQRNRWKLYDRTNTISFKKEDIATWTVEDLHKKIGDLYLQSIDNEKLLQQTKLEPYNAIIIKGNVRHLRPTLYDLLAHKALDYFENDERLIKRPAYSFEINHSEAFAPAAEFVSNKFITKDSLSLHHKALLIYQDLISFHLKDDKPEALLDLDIQRIQFVYQNSVAENKDELYKKALENLTLKYANHPGAAQAWYLLAAYYEQLAAGYDPLKDTTHRYTRIKAKEILERVVKDSAVKSEGWTNSYNLLKEINHKIFSFEVEKVNVPAQPFRSLVKYRNVSNLSFRLIKADEELKMQLQNNYDNKYWNALVNAQAIRSWQQTLPATNDLQQHSVEIKIEQLSVGEYILLASADENFQKKNSPLGARLFYVSNISYINQTNEVFVLHRESGQPLANAAVQVYNQEYDYKTYKYIKTKFGSYKTDKNGYLQIAERKQTRNRGYFLDVTYQNDRLALDDLIYHYYYYDDERRKEIQRKKIFFFTDRSIYRPGQTVHFKGIVITSNKKDNQIVTNYKTKVLLQNANGEDADSIEVTTNEFGSFSGKFQLSQNTLNGIFRVYEAATREAAEISVEEYKRPKFYVEFEKIKGSYKVNDSITVIGNSKAYAGNVVDGAKVSYRVIREPRFPYPWIFWRWWQPPAAPMEIAHGETTTDKDGKFTIRFKAIPDLKIDKKFDPVFDYRIYADVTDINGETRSGEEVVTVGYKSLLLKVNVPEKMPVDSFKNISVRTENMNGEFEKATVTVSIFKLIPEQRLIRNRYWQQPDQFAMSKDEFIRHFPHDEYRNESDFKTWQRGEKVFERTDSTKINSEFRIQNSELSSGFYTIEVTTKDKDGNEVKDVRFVELFDPKSKQLKKPEYLWAKGSDKPIEPGEKTDVQIGSAAQNVFVVHQVDRSTVDGRPSTDYTYVELNKDKRTFDFSATEADRGGYGVNFFFVKDNRFYQFGDVISVPWSNKDLSIEYATFRDKTLSGSEEKWTVKLLGYKNEKVAAEILASMYDASLDQFKMHSWNKPGIWPVFARLFSWNGEQNFTAIESQQKWSNENNSKSFKKQYDYLNFGGNENRRLLKGRASGVELNKDASNEMADVSMAPQESRLQTDTLKLEEIVQTSAITKKTTQKPQINNSEIQIRKNFNETAFFFPDLRTDKDGNISFSFTMPEALTRWKFQALSHTKELAFGITRKEIVTQKELMVQPNAPRFVREGDKMEFTSKIVNLSDKEITGQAQLLLIDATTNQLVDGWFQNMFPNQYFTVAAGQSEVVKFPIEVPYQFNKALVWRVVARAGNVSDGEEMALPVLTNKMLVTETMPLPMRGSGTKTFTFAKLLNSSPAGGGREGAETLQNHALTVEYTSNPAWYAVQALPYLMEYPYDCAEQIWNRYYANALATKIANSSPRIKQIFQSWKTLDTSALLSNLQKNQELKSALLKETPWVMEAKTEAQQKKNIALLFDLIKMSSELKSNLEILKQMQSSNGGFVWFKGGPDDRYITQYIATGIGHLKKLGGYVKDQDDDLTTILNIAIPYLDRKIKEDYDNLIKYKADLKQQQIGYIAIQYLYMRSFFPEHKIPQASQTAYAYYRKQAQQFWMKQNKYMQGMTALALHRTGDLQTPKDILRSLKETSINNEELGMYWKDVNYGISWFWWHAPIETQSLLIEAFSEIGNDTKTVNDLKTWLIKNKQTNNWRTTKATADAVYAMLLQGSDWLTYEPEVEVKLGNSSFISTKIEKAQAGTGFVKKSVEGSFIQPAMGNISVTVKRASYQSTDKPLTAPSWGAVYWQYFENLDKITTASTPLQLNKKLFIEKNTDRGPVLSPIIDGTELHVGDKVKVRIELRVDRDMEYVHMKDMRASALEPTNVLSGYKWQGGLGYYESTRDVSTSFFFNYLRKGTYVFEYPLFVTHTGNFSNGITTIQSMYAPEFSAHSEGVRIRVETPNP